jgi:hypothetical protein
LAHDRRHGFGLYEFIAGRPARPEDVSADTVGQAVAFYRDLNRHKESSPARDLPGASEACFTLSSHLQCVERRLQRLHDVDDAAPLGRDAARFVRTDLAYAWTEVTASVREQSSRLGLSPDQPLDGSDRHLSPSDFGFHNALVREDGRVCFLDFEYAGWDDPAKTVCDFFCQPAVPIARDYFDLVLTGVVADLSEPDRQRERIALLLPVYQVKWCAILLNDFLPVGSQRRRFANGATDQTEQKARQLQKARNLIRSLQPWHSQRSKP